MPRSGHIGWAVGTLVLALPACQTSVGLDDGYISPAALLSGKAIFGEEVSSAERPDIDILATDDAMREFVADLPRASQGAARFRRLMQRMRSGSYAVSGYDPYANLSARAAFAEKRGQLPHLYQPVHRVGAGSGFRGELSVGRCCRRTNDSVNGMVVLNKHVNARVERVPRSRLGYRGVQRRVHQRNPRPSCRGRPIRPRIALQQPGVLG